MAQWSTAQLEVFNKAPSIQNRPYDNSGKTFQDNPIWVVVANNKVYLRGGKGTESNWYKQGIKNGGEVSFGNDVYKINYVPVKDEDEIKDVTAAYKKKYHGQYPIDMMVTDKCAHATVSLELR